jgi:hypothetical protein
MDRAAVSTIVRYVLQRVSSMVTFSSTLSTSLRYFAVSTQRGKQLQPVDVLKGCLFDTTSGGIPEDKQVGGPRLGHSSPLSYMGWMFLAAPPDADGDVTGGG